MPGDDLNPLESPMERERRQVARDDADLRRDYERDIGVFDSYVDLEPEDSERWGDRD